MAIASAALDDYRSESRKMVVALVDMERAFIPPQHFIRLVQRRCGWSGEYRYYYTLSCSFSNILPSVHAPKVFDGQGYR